MPKNYGSKSLAFRTFTFDKKGEVLFTHDKGGRRMPAYAVSKSRFSKPHVRVARIAGSSWHPQTFDIGSIAFHSLSSKMDINLHGHSMQMRRDALSFSGRHNFDWPPVGNLEWKEKKLGNELHLLDSGDRVLARCKSKWSKIGEKSGTIEILVPGDDYFIDMVVVTGLAKWKYQKKEHAAASGGADAAAAVATA
ncbi:uncharacterized protein HMPREF1541_04678 [Cyphellophora europaea CBS 101466]|uniref:DUF6593 domain-containing protein n=1 Tax=Cyphellophora europaea (strain CBS 101466) TaxID=1220924 RepID=W2RV85_CYPE1|nr:uncharacterized protein HMPREF1541_04678 [Cyphellophora europaea CBS 101466]ETN40401.1 hypothetical protein HMPREF1541_04678 [Cyphellophora europaea CBS 101466]